MWENIVIIAVLVAIVAGIVAYLIKAKKRGDKCIGCPYGKQCASKHNCTCNQNKTNDNVR